MKQKNIIKVFILEDYEHKLQDIVDVLKNEFQDGIIIKSCAYFNESLSILDDEEFDYAILDNNVPRFSDSSDIVKDSAEDAISWLELMGISTKCIICSSDEVKLEEKHDNCLGIVKYSSISLDWSKQLLSLIRNHI